MEISNKTKKSIASLAATAAEETTNLRDPAWVEQLRKLLNINSSKPVILLEYLARSAGTNNNDDYVPETAIFVKGGDLELGSGATQHSKSKNNLKAIYAILLHNRLDMTVSSYRTGLVKIVVSEDVSYA
jgi:hypothetical protein